MLEFVGDAGPRGRRLRGLPARRQRHAHALAIGAPFGRRAAAVDVGDQAGDDFLFLLQQRAAHRLGRMRGEHRLDAQARQQRGDLVGADALGLQVLQHRAQPARLRPGTVALVIAATADAMHALGQVDRLEIGGKGAHQVGGALERRLRQDRGQLGRALARFAAADRRAPDPLDVGEEVRAHLLGQDFADQGTELVDVIAQQPIAGAEVEVAAGIFDQIGRREAHAESLTQAPRSERRDHLARGLVQQGFGIGLLLPGEGMHDHRAAAFAERLANLEDVWVVIGAQRHEAAEQQPGQAAEAGQHAGRQHRRIDDQGHAQPPHHGEHQQAGDYTDRSEHCVRAHQRAEDAAVFGLEFQSRAVIEGRDDLDLRITQLQG